MSEQDAEQDTGPTADEPETDDEGGSESATDELAAEVAAYDEELAAAVEERGERVEDLEAQLDETRAELEEVEERLQRERADFQNYKKRAEKREERLREQATEDLVTKLLDVRDNLVRALEQEDDADVRDGVEATLSSFDNVLDGENVEAIEPEPGDEVDPQVHEVMMRVDGDQPAGTIEDVYRPGYRMGEKVLRTAQVTVSEETDEDDASAESAESDDEKSDEESDDHDG